MNQTNKERKGYHQSSASGAAGGAQSKPNPFKSAQSANSSSMVSPPGGNSSNQERKCDSCKYSTPVSQCQTFRCRDCGIYVICEYCYEDYMEKGGYYDNNADSTFTKKIQCVYCWSRHTLTDICVKTLKSLGFMPVKGSNKIQISNLTREKIKKLSNLRVIQKTLVYVIGIAPEIASEEKLKSVQYFGQYGNLQKVVVNTKDVYNATRGGPSYSAYLTFNSARESAIAILSVDQFVLNDRMIRASFGTSKFCQFFLNNQKCNNKDCLYLHELRADLEAYTKEDMQNNKFIFLEQQKIAIKLSKALDLSKEQFNRYNYDRNPLLKTATDRAKQQNVALKSVLPEPSYIYHKDFHFLDEPLIERQRKREQALAAKAAAALKNQQNQANNEVDSASTQATNQSQGAPISMQAKPGAKLATNKLKATAEAQEESKSSALPIFTNQKDVSNQARKQSQLRAPISKAASGANSQAQAQSLSGAESSSAKNSQSASSNQAHSSSRNNNPPTNSEGKLSDQASQQAAQGDGKQKVKTSNTLFSFEQLGKGAPSNSKEEVAEKSLQGEDQNVLQKQSNQSSATIFQNLITSQMANQAAQQSEKVGAALAGAPERQRKKEFVTKKKKKILMENREQASSGIGEANIKKVEPAAALAIQTSPVKINGKEAAGAPSDPPEESKEAALNPTPSGQAPAQKRTVLSQNNAHEKSQSQAAPEKSKQNWQSPPQVSNKFSVAQVASVSLTNQGASDQASAMGAKEKAPQQEAKIKKNDFSQTQTVSLGSFKKFGAKGGDDDTDSEQSPSLQFSRTQSRFQFAHSVDPIKKEANFKFGFGLGAASDVDKEVILVPVAVQELISRSIRTLSNSISNRSPEEARQREASDSLIPVEEIEAELEQKWYTLEEQAQENMMEQNRADQSPTFEESKISGKGGGTLQTNYPFRMMSKKDKEAQQQAVGSNLDVKRVKYSYKQTSPSGEDKHMPESEESKGKEVSARGGALPKTSPFQPSTKDSARVTKGGRRAGPQAERARQPPMNR